MTASQDKQLQQGQGAVCSMPPPPRPGLSSIESVIPDFELGQQAGGRPSWPKCAPYFSFLIKAKWCFFGQPEPANAHPLGLILTYLMNHNSVQLTLSLKSRVYMTTVGFRIYERVLQEGIANGMTLEESRASSPQRMMERKKNTEKTRADNIQLQDAERIIKESLRWKALVDAIGVPEVFLIDYENEGESQFQDDLPVPEIASASDEEWPHLLAKLLSPELGLKETCLKLSGIIDMIERLKELEESELRKYLVSSIEKRVESVLGSPKDLPGYESDDSDDDSMADAE